MRKLILAALMGPAIAGAAEAETIVQERPFDITLSSVAEPDLFLSGGAVGPVENYNVYVGNKSLPLSFDAFDPALGTLHGVSLNLQSTYAQTELNSMLVIGQLGTGAVASGSAGMGQQLTVTQNGRTLFEKPFDLTRGDCHGIGVCFIEMHNDGVFDRNATPDLNGYPGSGPIAFNLAIRVVQEIRFEPHPPDYPTSNEQGPFGFRDLSQWEGMLRLTYSYDAAVAPPSAIPAPAGASLLALGLTGLVAARRRKGIAS